MKAFVFATLFVSFTSTAIAQISVPFDSLAWTISGKISKETFQGKEGIWLMGESIVLKDSTFKNGIIEFDMTLAQDRYFPGLGFRIQDKDNYESVYLRPHQLGNPDAIQYTPVFNNQAGWQFYYGEGYSDAITYPLNEWIHIKLVVKDMQAEIYVHNQAKAALIIHQLKRTISPGRIGLYNGSEAITRFANFSYTKQDNPPLVGPFLTEAKPLPGTILAWLVSNPFNEKQLDNQMTLPNQWEKGLTWTTLATENSGLLNVSQISKIGEGSNTVFAKVVLTADKLVTKKLQLGFSDRVKVYLNNQILYGGQDGFRSRDYRFLGTVGYFDEIYLPLKKGRNELWIAVSENFGGWGIKGMITDQSGLSVITLK
jgi:hypothetical protein